MANHDDKKTPKTIIKEDFRKNVTTNPTDPASNTPPEYTSGDGDAVASGDAAQSTDTSSDSRSKGPESS